MMPIRAVVCGDLNLLRCFNGLPIETLVVASDPREVTLRSRRCKASALISKPSEPDRALADLLEIGRCFSERPVLYYGTDAMLLIISKNRAALSQYFRFRMPEHDLVETLVSKQRFAKLASEACLPVPETLSSDQVSRAEDVLARLGLPCLFKPSVHVGWFQARAAHGLSPHKALLVTTRAELEGALAELSKHCDSFVVQRYVPGGEDCIYSYHAYLSARSEPLGEFAGRKLRTYPKQAGVSTYLELVRCPDLIDVGRALCSRLGLSGPVKLDFKRAPDTGKFYLLEINARFTLWNYLGAVSGVNLPAVAYADLTGARPAPQRHYDTSVRWLSFGNDLRAFLRDYRRDGSLDTWDWLNSYRARKVYDIFEWRDPVPFLANALQFSGALSRRLLRAPAR